MKMILAAMFGQVRNLPTEENQESVIFTEGNAIRQCHQAKRPSVSVHDAVLDVAKSRFSSPRCRFVKEMTP